MEIEYFYLPSFWASALINGDYSGLDNDDQTALDAFTAWMISEYGQCWCLTCDGTESDFRRLHDATSFGVLACDVEQFAFDVTKR